MNPHRAFTLIEVMVTVLVIAVLSTLMLPSFMGSFQKTALNTATQDLTTALRYLQHQAVLTGRPHRLVLIAQDPSSGLTTYHAQAAAVDLDEAKDFLPLTHGLVKPTTLPQGIALSRFITNLSPAEGQPPAVHFYPDGSADAVVFQFQGEHGQTHSVLIEPTAGRVHRALQQVNTLPNLREDLDV